MTAFAPGGLAAICLCLAGVVTYQIIAPVAPPAAPVADPGGIKIVAPAPSQIYTPPPEEQFAIINARPAFDPARKPVAEPELTNVSVDAPSDVSLVGVAISANGSVALVKTPDLPAAVSLRVGQSIRGWTLVQVARDYVVFRGSASSFTVRLRSAKGVPQPPLNDVPAPDVTGQPGH
jgi:hypothetical protein